MLRRASRCLGFASALFLVGCGGSTAGTGEEPADTGSLLDDTGADATTDSGTDDTATADSGADTTVGDTGGGADGAGDGSGADAGGDDASDADSSATDSVASDTAASDSAAIDSGSADTGTIDSGPTDTGTVDAPTDTGPTGLYPAAGKISCSSDGSGMCSGGKVCCGRWLITWSHSCETSCLGGRTFECDETADCAGKICCANTPPLSTSVTGSSCRSDCGGDPQLCMKDSDCGAKKCSPFKTPDLGTAMGVCK